MLAEAGLRRLGIEPEHVERFDEDVMVPAPGQGALAVQARVDGDARHVVSGFDDGDSHAAFDAERKLVALLGGGCALPLGAFARVADGRVGLRAVVFTPDGSRFLESWTEGTDDVASRVASELLDAGAGEILAELR